MAHNRGGLHSLLRDRKTLDMAISETSSLNGLARRIYGGRVIGTSERAYTHDIMLSLGIEFPSHWTSDEPDWSPYLVCRAPGSPRTSGVYLKLAMIQAGVPYACEICDCDPVHNGIPLSLAVDHIDGQSHNNELHNLRFLCPNCHAQVETSSASAISGLIGRLS